MLEPTIDLGKLLERPLAALVGRDARRPARVACDPCAFRGCDQYVKVLVSWYVDSVARGRRAIESDDPGSLVSRKPQNESREVVRERSRTDVIPVDQANRPTAT